MRVLLITVSILIIILIPLKIISYGFLPPDDALRHAAKAVSGKAWTEILITRPDITFVAHSGWEFILRTAFKITNCPTRDLVIYPVLVLFALFACLPLFFFKKPYVWTIALFITAVASPHFIFRMMLGRPFIISICALLVLFYQCSKLKSANGAKSRAFWIITASIALSVWIHGLWYMFYLTIPGFIIAKEYKTARKLFIAVTIGVIAGSLMTGSGLVLLSETVKHALRSLFEPAGPNVLVREFQPFDGQPIMLIIIALFIIWRHVNKTWRKEIVVNPIFIFASITWLFGFVVTRFWLDWGVPVLCLWMASEINDIIKLKNNKETNWREFLITLISGLILFSSVTANSNNRWMTNLESPDLSLDNSALKNWLPDPGGILYTNEMDFFYLTFYANPHAEWRYILGFEPSIMPADDLAVLRKIQTYGGGSYKILSPWVNKMDIKDRLLIKDSGMPAIPELEWKNVEKRLWMGRLPRTFGYFKDNRAAVTPSSAK